MGTGRSTYSVQRVERLGPPVEMQADICQGQENGPDAAKDEKAHARLFRAGPPLLLLLEIDEGVDGEAQLGDGKG